MFVKMKKHTLVFVLSLSIGIIFLSLLSGVEENSKITPFTIYEIVEQCSDGVQNYDETGVDCGGSCAACSEGEGEGGGGGGGGGGGTPVVIAPSIIETQSIDVVTPGSTAIVKDFDPETGIKQIQIDVKTEVQDLSITVSKYDGRPIEVTKEKSGKVYRYLKIEVPNLGDNLEKATVTIQVERSWVSDNGLERRDIAMFRFDENSEKWGELKTNHTESDETYHYYDAELDSFSYFVIGEKRGFLGSISWWVWALVIIIILIVVGVVIWRKKEQSKITQPSF